MLASCTSEDILEPEPFRPDMENRHRLVETTGVRTYTPDEFSSAFAQAVNGYIMYLYPDLPIPAEGISLALKSFVSTRSSELYWKFVLEGHFSYSFTNQKFTFRSVRADGDSATFSGSVLYPTPGSGSHILDGMTLLHNYANADDNSLLTKQFDMLYLRVIYNQAIVFCDTEGFGADYGQCVPYFDGFSKGRQQVDAAIAANEILRKRGITFRGDAFTENIGVSLGGNSAMGAQKYLESSQCPDWVEEEVLPGFRSFVTDCPTSVGKILDCYMDNDSLTIPCTVPMMVSTLFATQPEAADEFTFYDYFDENINRYRITNSKGRKVGELDAFIQSLLPQDKLFVYFASYGSRMKKFMNQSLFNEYGRLDRNLRQVQLLYNCLDKIDIAKDWTPEHPMLWLSSPDDDVIPYTVSQDTYIKFKDNHGEVVLIPTAGTHVESTGISMILSSALARPSTTVSVSYLKDSDISDILLFLTEMLGE